MVSGQHCFSNFQGYVILVITTEFAMYFEISCGILKKDKPNEKKIFIAKWYFYTRFGNFIETYRFW